MAIQAIDTHVHLRDELTIASMGDRALQMARYFGRALEPVSVDELADQYRARDMMAVLMNTTDETTSGIEAVPNDHIADAVRRHPDVFIGFGAVDPWQGRLAVDEVRRCIEELGLRGIGEMNPGRQAFAPNDHRFYDIWQEAARLEVPILFHTGFIAAGAGTPGGLGYKLEYCRPIPFLDDVAADIPELTIIAAHPSWPWADESLAIARHKSNVWIDLSGWAPKYFPATVTQYARTMLQDRCLFGSDWPALTPERWIEEFDGLGIPPEVRSKILLGNAKRLFGLDLDA